MSFRDTFTREEERDNVLDYDDSAFLYVAGTFLLFVLVPWTARLVWTYLYPRNRRTKQSHFPERITDGRKVAYCQCTGCRESRFSASTETDGTTWNFLRTAQVTCVVLLWSVFFLVVIRLLGVEPIQSFDPYEILGISMSATDKEIKKAYRVMSLRLHPDKNPNDPTASAKFVMISKAYAALTDELAKMNYEKYGNPDGPSAMKVGIGLPRMLVAEANQLFVLIVFFTFLLVVVPSAFIVYFRRQRLYAPNGVRLETLHFYARFLSEQTRLKQGPEFLAASAESRDMAQRDGDDAVVKRLSKDVEQPKKCPFNHPVVIRNYLMILAHMQRLRERVPQQQLADLDTLLKQSLDVSSAMLEIAFFHKWLVAAQSMLDFRRRLVQALDFTAVPGQQLPHSEQCTKKVKELTELIKHKDYEKFSMLKPEDLEDVKAVVAHLPAIEIRGRVFVDDEDEIVAGDVATIDITLTRTQLEDDQVAGPTHAPNFPETKFEEWWIFATEKGSGAIVGFLKSKSRDKVVHEKIQFQVAGPGRHILQIAALCDSYTGLDRLLELGYKAASPKEVRREVFVHPEDAALDQEPTLFQQIAGIPILEDSSEDED